MEALIILLFLIACIIGFGFSKRYLVEKSRMKRQEIAHQERIIAMEKGIPLDQLEQGQDFSVDAYSQPRSQKSALVWVRLATLCMGLIFLAAGVGICISLALVPEPEANELWSLGIIPGLVGIGLLLFYGLSRGFASQLKVE